MLIIVKALSIIYFIWQCHSSHLKNIYQDVCVFGIQLFVNFANSLEDEFCLMYGMQRKLLSL